MDEWMNGKLEEGKNFCFAVRRGIMIYKSE